MHLVLDVTTEIRKASLFFSKRQSDITVSRVQTRIDTICVTLDAMKLRPGMHVISFSAEIGDDNVFEEVTLTTKAGDEASFIAAKDRFLGQSKNYFKERFSNIQNDPVLKGASDITDPLLWLKERQELFTYGERQLGELANHFEDLLAEHSFDDQACVQE